VNNLSLAGQLHCFFQTVNL